MSAIAWGDPQGFLEQLAGGAAADPDATLSGLAAIAAQLGLAFMFGVLVAAVYVWTQRKTRAEAASLAATLILLTILICMVTVVIGNNVARAFSLAGALAIIRFRTVVEDTRDTAFVIFAVVVGMGVGAGYWTVSLLGIPIVAVAAWLATQWSGPAPPPGREYTLLVRLGVGHDPNSLRPVFDKHLQQVRLLSTATGRQGAALDLTYHVRFRPDADEIALVTELNRVEGVQSVEVR